MSVDEDTSVVISLAVSLWMFVESPGAAGSRLRCCACCFDIGEALSAELRDHVKFNLEPNVLMHAAALFLVCWAVCSRALVLSHSMHVHMSSDLSKAC